MGQCFVDLVSLKTSWTEGHFYSSNELVQRAWPDKIRTENNASIQNVPGWNTIKYPGPIFQEPTEKLRRHSGVLQQVSTIREAWAKTVIQGKRSPAAT